MKRLIVIAALAACGKSSSPPPPQPERKPPPEPVVQKEAVVPPLDLDGMDRAAKPGDEFYKFTNGTWLAKTEIPADRASWGMGSVMHDRTEKRIAELVAATVNAPMGTESRKISDFVTAFRDTKTIEAKGYKVLEPAFAEIAAIKEPRDLARVLGGTLRADTDAINSTNFVTPHLFGLWVAADLDEPTKYIVYFMQGGLGMPGRDYYLDPSPAMAELRTKYKAHIAKLLTLAGQPDTSEQVLALEIAIAKAHATRTDSADSKNGLVRWKREEFATKAPGLEWDALFEAAGIAGQPAFGNWHAKATTGIAALGKSMPLETWKAWLTFHAIDDMGGVLPRAVDEENFAFYGTAVYGIPKQRDRDKRAIENVQHALGWPLGRLYVARYFPPAAKTKIQTMVKAIMAAFDRRIDALTWMSAPTKAKAKAKLAAMKVGVGYPDRWRDYGRLEIANNDAYGNAVRASKFELAYQLAKLGKPVDRDEWFMTPQLVDAVNLPALNAMNFPAGILQPPAFDPSRPDVLDYGAVGAVIGHEISHGFDDQGAQFDITGRLVNWWTKEDLDKFAAQGKSLVAQYNAYKPLPDLAINGAQTLSENIADVAGLAAAFDAYKASGTPAPALGGLTSDQQFFVSFAQFWRSKEREPSLRAQVLTDGHSPAEYRALTVRNLDGWYTAFDVKPGDKLYLAPAARVRVW